uniref:Uncharacterized protein n=1 Tax=Anguilla anguilla TaxID=7936 RepID=A0A0E9WDE7_ANGAN
MFSYDVVCAITCLLSCVRREEGFTLSSGKSSI